MTTTAPASPAVTPPPLVCAVLARLRLDLTDEKRAQAQIAEALEGAGIAFAREHRLGPGDVVDFLIAGGIALEVKTRRARPADILRQLRRYAAHEAVTALILASNRAMGLPSKIQDKPAHYVGLGAAWL